MRGRSLAVVAAFTVAGGVGSLYLENAMFQTTEPGTAAEAAVPEYFFDQFRMRVMGADGRPEYVLGGERLIRLSGADSSEIAAPRLRITRTREAPWDVAAERAWLFEASELIKLRGSVVLARAAHGASPALDVATEALDVDTAGRVARTDVPVRVRSDTWQIESAALVARFEEGLLDLTGNVHGTYRPAAEAR